MVLAGGALMALAGCETAVVPAAVAPPSSPPPSAPAEPAPPARSEASLELERHYARIQSSLLVQGLLRTDGGGPDTPFTSRDLARNFERIAFFEEYTNVSGRFVQRQTASQLHRWGAPVRIQTHFGKTVDQARRDRDARAIERYARRLSAAAGHPIRSVRSGGNYHVFILHEGERREIGPRLREIIPELGDGAVRAVEDMPRSSYCLVFAWDPRNDGVYTRAIAVIRAEHPDLFRLSCIHEELAQGLGLANDSPEARPSIFNDDEEFALLTTHDELLLSILYDARLRPGMGADEARPIVRQIAEDLMGGGV